MSSAFTPGSLVGGCYRVGGIIGRGGMATVYVAHDEKHARDVAIKVLSPTATGTLGAERFVEEIRTTASLSHPHIVPLLDSGSADGWPFYVTPYIRGESLKERLARDETLPLQDALRLAAALAAALGHAHAEGVIHRDVKPANILLDSMGNAYLADFGVARALAVAGDSLRTATGELIGTLAYTSPEQASAESEVDGTTDLYALGCVLFEMLAGRPPFTERSARALLAAHLLRQPPSIRDLRADVPRSVDELIAAMLDKDPATRIPTATEVRRRLEDVLTASRADSPQRAATADPARPRSSGGRPLPRRLALAWGTAALIAVGAGMLGQTLTSRFGFGTEPDTTRYAVLAFEGDVAADGVPLVSTVEDALRGWEGIEVVEGEAVARALGAEVGIGLGNERARSLGRELDAGRLVAGTAVLEGDSIRVELTLRAPASFADPLARVAFTAPRDVVRGNEEVARAVEMLAFGGPPAVRHLASGTSSAAARRSFGLGLTALRDWDLVEAERHLAAAIEDDPYFDLALLWRAQAMNWLGRLNREWAVDAGRAARAADDLPARERLLAIGLAAMADGDYPAACAAYGELERMDSRDFAALYGLGECRSDDPLVVPDAGSRTGWSFRSSGHAAARAYRDAFEVLPSSFRAFGAGSSDLVGALLYTERGALRRGIGPASRPFVGFKEWRGDSLAFTAVPVDSLLFYDPDPLAAGEALTQQRRAFLEVANTWSNAFPASAGATYTLAVARELVGDASALATYREARAMTRDAALAMIAGAAEVLLAVRLAMPHDLDAIRGAAELADSILGRGSDASGEVASRLAELAVLVGRPALAACLGRRSDVGAGIGNVPLEVRREAQALLAFSAVGGPTDSIRQLEARVNRLIQQIVPRGEARSVRQNVLERAAFLAYPHHRSQFFDSVGLARLPEARAIAAFEAGQETVLATLGDPPPEATWDVLLARTSVLAALGLSAEALAILSPRLDALADADPAEVRDMGRAGAWARAAALRADLEWTVGSAPTAVRWARAIDALWVRGEEGVNPVHDRLRIILDEGGAG